MADTTAQGGADSVPDPRQEDPEQGDPHQCIADAEDTPSICAQGSVPIAWAEGPGRGLGGAWSRLPLSPPKTSLHPSPAPLHTPPPMVVMMVPEKKKALPKFQAE